MPRHNVIDWESAVALYIEGYGVPELAKRFGISNNSLYRRLKAKNVMRTQSQAAIMLDKLHPEIHDSVGKKVALKNGRGEAHPNWRGGKIDCHSAGYIRIYNPNHPRAYRNYVYEHIVNWEKANNQTLPEGYVIHHINGDKKDNHPSNLLALPKTGHSPTMLLVEVQKKLRELEAKHNEWA